MLKQLTDYFICDNISCIHYGYLIRYTHVSQLTDNCTECNNEYKTKTADDINPEARS